LEDDFPTRRLHLEKDSGLAAAPRDPRKVHQHIEGLPGGKRVMTDAEVTEKLRDPFAMLLLRNGVFPRHLGEIHGGFDIHNATPDALPNVSSFLIAEGGQIPFAATLTKGSARLISVRSRVNGTPEVLISTLVGPGNDPRSDQQLNEIQSWDPVNRTMHFYQRQAGVWFWCGQSDMALVAPTRGRGPFDSHINGYPVMKELKTPWVHWHGPSLGISENAFAANDPLVSDRLFVDRDHAANFETEVVRPLMERWNSARFDKHTTGNVVDDVKAFGRQILESTSANLVSTHSTWSSVVAGNANLDDIPATFFCDVDGLVGPGTLGVNPPAFPMSGPRYVALTRTYGLRVKSRPNEGNVDFEGDVPFAFTVPERSEEDQLVVRVLVDRDVASSRLIACMLMVDFPNPVASTRRARLSRYLPNRLTLGLIPPLDDAFVQAVTVAAPNTSATSPEREFLANWALGPGAWQATFVDRLETFFDAIVQQLGSDAGSDAIFRLGESRRRQFRKRPLAEFGLSLAQATLIAEKTKPLFMNETARVVSRR
jgi:hypothetical protein